MREESGPNGPLNMSRTISLQRPTMRRARERFGPKLHRRQFPIQRLKEMREDFGPNGPSHPARSRENGGLRWNEAFGRAGGGWPEPVRTGLSQVTWCEPGSVATVPDLGLDQLV